MGGVERQVIQAKQELTLAGFRERFFCKTSDIVGNVADGPFAKPPDAVDFRHHRSPAVNGVLWQELPVI